MDSSYFESQTSKKHQTKQEEIMSLISPFVKQGYPFSATSIWLEAFNWYFLGVTFLFHIVNALFMIYSVGYEPLFVIIYSMMWYLFPYINLRWLTAGETYQYNVI